MAGSFWNMDDCRTFRGSASFWMIVWLAIGATMFALAFRQLADGQQLRQRLLEAGKSLDNVPSTMLSQHPAAAVALVCCGLICFVFALRRYRSQGK